MIEQHFAFAKQWMSGKGRSAVWEDCAACQPAFRPQYFVNLEFCKSSPKIRRGDKLGVMNITSSTNERTIKCAYLPSIPCGDSAYTLQVVERQTPADLLRLSAFLNSFVADYQMRLRLTGLHLSEYILSELLVPSLLFTSEGLAEQVSQLAARLEFHSPSHAVAKHRMYLLGEGKLHANACMTAATESERLRVRVLLDAVMASVVGLSVGNVAWLLRDCDHPASLLRSSLYCRRLSAKGFWRVDKNKDPELRHTALTQIALRAPTEFF